MKPDARRKKPDSAVTRHPSLNTSESMTMPSPLEDPLAELLDRWADITVPPGPHRSRVHGRLMARVNESAKSACAFRTLRRHELHARQMADGVTRWPLYEHHQGPMRPGEPLRAMLLELDADTYWILDELAETGAKVRREWLVLRGELAVDGVRLQSRSYLVTHAGAARPRLHSDDGTLVYVREVGSELAEPSHLQHDAPSLWEEFAPGIRRRVMWRQGPEAAMLYETQAGAGVPLHSHQHDEECLMLDGELFLDDILLRGGEYQLAPAGTRHGGVFTDTGAVVFAHGDLDLQILAT